VISSVRKIYKRALALKKEGVFFMGKKSKKKKKKEKVKKYPSKVGVEQRVKEANALEPPEENKALKMDNENAIVKFYRFWRPKKDHSKLSLKAIKRQKNN